MMQTLLKRLVHLKLAACLLPLLQLLLLLPDYWQK